MFLFCLFVHNGAKPSLGSQKPSKSQQFSHQHFQLLATQVAFQYQYMDGVQSYNETVDAYYWMIISTVSIDSTFSICI